MSRVGRASFVSGVLIALSAVLLPWSGVQDWKLYILSKWDMGALGLLLSIFGSLLAFREVAARSGLAGFHSFIRYMSLAGLAFSVTMLFFGSWSRVIVLSLGIIVNWALVLYSWRVKDIRARSRLLMILILMLSFLAIVVWNFISTVLIYFPYL